MQQFARVLQAETIVPVLHNDSNLLDLRPIIHDITPETIGSGVLNKIDISKLKVLAGNVTYLQPIAGIRQFPATGFNYKKHIEELKVPAPTEPEVFLK